MAKRKAPKTAFKKGQSGNPNGRPKLCKDIVLVRGVVGAEVAKMGHLLTMTMEELQAVLKDPKSTALEVIAAKALITHKWPVIDNIINRTHGKPKDTIDIKADVNVTGELTDEQLKKAAEEMLHRLNNK